MGQSRGGGPSTAPPEATGARRNGPVDDEVPVFPTQETIEGLAGRIEQAYLRRYPDWTASRTSPRVWETAASGLAILHRIMPTVPMDAELFVAVQPRGPVADPWTDLTGDRPLRRYRHHVRRIVVQLRDEIVDEVRRVERLVRRGSPLVTALTDLSGRLSPLARYVVARRAGHDELAERLRPDAERQHKSCPLYQQACRALLPVGTYPLPRPTGLPHGLAIPAGAELPCFSMN